MRIAVIGGSLASAYFPLANSWPAARDLGLGAQRPDDVQLRWCSPTRRSAGSARRPVVYRDGRFARWDDIDIHFRPGDGRPDG
jgi:hypothetical protein